MIRAAVRNRPKMPVDRLLFGVTLALVVLGLWLVFDTSYVKTLDSAKLGHDAFFFVKRQAVGAVVGLFALVTMMHFGYWRLRALAIPLMLCGIGLLISVWLPVIGIRENNANRWADLGPIRFQPSEVAKLTLIIYVAALLSRAHANVRNFSEGLLPLLLVSGLYLLLIEREPDMGTAFVLFLAVFTQLYLGGARKRHLALACGVALLGVMLFAFTSGGTGHRLHRLTAFLNPEHDLQGVGYQIFHSRLAVGSGGWFGMGLGQGKEKFFLPQGNSDFVFATLAEELGFLRTALVLLLLLCVGWRGFVIAGRTKDRFGALLAAGIAALISWQALLNIAVATASVPATGVPLPFISYGSTSLVFLMAGVGILLNIAQHPTTPTQAITERKRAAGG